MSKALQATFSAPDIDAADQDSESVARALADVLSDTYRLLFKTDAYHWNVEGEVFAAINTLTAEQHDNMFAAAEALAARIRSLGHLAPSRMQEVMDRSGNESRTGALNTSQMMADLATEHEAICHRLMALLEAATLQNDIPTEDITVERLAFHQQAGWLLRCIAQA